MEGLATLNQGFLRGLSLYQKLSGVGGHFIASLLLLEFVKNILLLNLLLYPA